MARKVFQDFAHVLCQRFIEVPSNRDLVNLALVGDGTWILDITMQKAMWNTFPMTPLPYAKDARDWLDSQMSKHAIPVEQLGNASLIVKCAVEFSRKRDWPFPSAKFDLDCTAHIASPDRLYTASVRAQTNWGLSTV